MLDYKSIITKHYIVQDVISSIKDGRTPIILTERREYAEKMYTALQNISAHTFLLLGNDSAKEKREKLDALRAVPKNESLVIIATGKYIGEGFDEPRLDTLFLAMPFHGKVHLRSMWDGFIGITRGSRTFVSMTIILHPHQ